MISYKKSGTDRYIVDYIKRFDQKDEMFKRPLWDNSLKDLGKNFYGLHRPSNYEPGYDLISQAFKNASYYIDVCFAQGMFSGRTGLYTWQSKPWGENPQIKGLHLDVNDPRAMSNNLKKAAYFYGASNIGITKLELKWLYSYHYYPKISGFTPTVQQVQIPENYKYAIILAYEIDYKILQHSPDYISGAAVGKGYSDMAYTAGMLAQFIRLLGYNAIPMGNDTALSIPLAIDAGLGELGRNGLLITPQFGPRVRLNKIFTDVPLEEDSLIELGVWQFCKICSKCANYCPSNAISKGKPTTKPYDISNNTGYLRWPVKAKNCFDFWAKNGTACSNCIRSCPFNKTRNIFHSTIRHAVSKTSKLNKILICLNNILDYGKKRDSKYFWN